MAEPLQRQLHERDRRTVFAALVESLEQGKELAEFRKYVGERFGLSERDVRRIWHEGMKNFW